MPDGSGYWLEDYYLANGDVGDPVVGISTLEYNFRDDYGYDPYGNQLHNVITPAQEEMVREALELIGTYMGVQFVETSPEPGVRTNSLTIAVGDVRSIPWLYNPFANTPYGLVAGEDGSSADSEGVPIDLVVMSNDAFEDTVDDYGANFFRTAMREILSSMGLGNAYRHRRPDHHRRRPGRIAADGQHGRGRVPRRRRHRQRAVLVPPGRATTSTSTSSPSRRPVRSMHKRSPSGSTTPPSATTASANGTRACSTACSRSTTASTI